MFFAHRLTRKGVEDLLDRHRAAADTSREHLEDIVRMLDDLPEAFFTKATALVGLRISEGTVHAIDEIRASIPKTKPRPKSEASATTAAKELFSRTPTRRRRGA